MCLTWIEDEGLDKKICSNPSHAFSIFPVSSIKAVFTPLPNYTDLVVDFVVCSLMLFHIREFL